MRDGTRRLQRVLLLGGTSEIGLATVRALALTPGAEVVLAGRDEPALRRAAGTLPAWVSTTTRYFDALEPASAVAVVRAEFERGDVDLVLPAFGVLGDQELFEADPVAAAGLVTVNLTTQTVVALEAARGLRAQGHGTLVLFSSIAGVRGRRANYVYGATKAGLDAVASGLDAALQGTGARVVLVRPGFVVGRMTAGLPTAPLPATPDEVGRAVADAVRTGRRVVWVPPAVRLVAWAARSTPRFLWARVRR